MLNREGSDPAVTADGASSAVIWNHSDPSYHTQDPYLDNLTGPGRDLWPVHRYRLATPGDQLTPIFSPDGQWLYFVTAKWDDKTPQMTMTLDRVPRETFSVTTAVAVSQGGETPVNPLHLATAQAQTLTNFPATEKDVRRLSFFPSGKRMLAQTSKGMLLFDIDGNKAKTTPIALPALKDVETGSQLTNLRDGWAGPGENEVTFSAETKDTKGLIRRRIYSCAFNGTGLKAWTPKDATPVPPYKFSNGQGDATALARAWALLEVKYETEDSKLHPQ